MNQIERRYLVTVLKMLGNDEMTASKLREWTGGKSWELNDALARLMREGYVQESGDGFKRIGSVESFEREFGGGS